MEIRKISREDEAAFPRFSSHREARMWFKVKYGDAFQMDESFTVGEGPEATVCYRCSLVLDRAAYEKGIRELAQGSMTDAGAFLKSYQTVEIMLDGSTHIIH